MIGLLLQALVVMLTYATLWYGVSLVVKRNDIADVAWGIGYIVLIGWLIWTRPVSPVAWVIYSLVTLWGLRLAIHIGHRIIDKAEDFRYRQWRQEWGASFYWRSYLQVYLLQGFLLVIIAMPVLIAASDPMAELSFWSWLGTGFWIVGFLIQSIADRQLAHFVRHRKSPAEVLDSGLWKYSRHPNYFGEILMWWAIFFIVWPLSSGWIAVTSPLTITFLLVFVSGVPMLEKRYADHPGYQVYKKRTNVLIPWWPANE
ncbi:MAG: DUF1295 domain-containing protein [Saprospiraceae bacterium]|nr:DUF1295 domain-containing protein [Saprospiraceae bacterium]